MVLSDHLWWHHGQNRWANQLTQDWSTLRFLDGGDDLMSFSSQIRQIFVTGRNAQSMTLPISIYHSSLRKSIDSHALINFKATGFFINHNLVFRNNWPKEKLPNPVFTHNANGTPNQKGMICFCTHLTLRIGEKEQQQWFYIVHQEMTTSS